VLPPPATPTPSGTPTDAGRDLESIQQLNATLDGIAILGGGHLPGEDVFHQSHMLLSNDRDGGFAGCPRVPRGFRPRVCKFWSFMHVIEKCLEPAGARGVAQLAERLGFDLAN